jgi:hypothetical protein
MKYSEVNGITGSPAVCEPLPQQYVLFRQGIALFPRKAPSDVSRTTQFAKRTFQSASIQGPSHISTDSVIASVLV